MNQEQADARKTPVNPPRQYRLPPAMWLNDDIYDLYALVRLQAREALDFAWSRGVPVP